VANDEIRVRLTGDDRDLRAAFARSRGEAVKFERGLKDVGTKGGTALSTGIGGGLATTTGKLGKFQAGLKSVGTVGAGFLLGGGIEAGFQQVTQYIGESIDAAANLEQAIGGTAAVFGDAAGPIEQFAKTSADSVGLSESAFREGTTVIGSALKRMTGDVDFAAEGSIKLTQVGADLAATFGGTTREAVDALGAAFRGEADPAERFGLGLSITAVQAYAAEKGINNLTTGSDEYARILLQMIEEQSKANGAMGQFGREADTAAGKAQRMAAELEDLQARSGEAFLPLQTGAMEAKIVLGGLVSFLTGDFATAWEGFKGLIFDAGGIINETGNKAGKMAGAIEHTGTKVVGLEKNVIDLSGGLDELSAAIDEVVGVQLDASAATIAFEEAVDAARKAVRDNGKTLDVNTEKGRNNQAALDDIAESTWELIEAHKRNNRSTNTLTDAMERGRKKFIDTAMAAGKTREQARKLADDYGLTERASDDLTGKSERTKDKLRDTEGQLRGTGDEAVILKGRYERVPKEVRTRITTPGMDNARDDVSKLNNALQGLPNVARIEFKTTGLGDGLGILGDGGGGLMGVSPFSTVGAAYTALGRPGDVTSGLRPGAFTATGNLSYHSMGRALDITPNMGIFELIRAAYKPRIKELIYSPAGGRQVHNGRDHYYSGITRSMHWDHIHFAMQHGAYVKRPWAGQVVMAERHPEIVSPEPVLREIVRTETRGGPTTINVTVNAGFVARPHELKRELATFMREFIKNNGGL
jgi:hypothetical protein